MAWRGVGAVLLDHGLSFSDLVVDPEPHDVHGNAQGGGVYRVAVLHAAHFILRIECVEGDAAAISMSLGPGEVVHKSFALPFTTPIAMCAFGFCALLLESTAGPFMVNVTYGRLTHAAAITSLRAARLVLWRYEDGTQIRAQHGFAGSSTEWDESRRGAQPLSA